MHIKTDFRDSDVKVGMAEVKLDGSVHTSRGIEVHGRERMGF